MYIPYTTQYVSSGFSLFGEASADKGLHRNSSVYVAVLSVHALVVPLLVNPWGGTAEQPFDGRFCFLS